MTNELTSDSVSEALQELEQVHQMRVLNFVYGYMSSKMDKTALREFLSEIQTYQSLESKAKEGNE